MTAKELTDWRETEASKAVGQKEGDAGSTGHRDGRRVVGLLGTKQADLAEDDLNDMKATGYVHRHLAQRPAGDVGNSRWRYSLVSWTQYASSIAVCAAFQE